MDTTKQCATEATSQGCRDTAKQGSNVGRIERFISGAAGAYFLGCALRGPGKSKLATLGSVILGGALMKRSVTGKCEVYSALGVSTHSAPGTVNIHHTVTVRAEAPRLYEFWRDFNNIPQFMRHIESIQMLDSGRSRWEMHGPLGSTFSWEAEISAERQNEYIAWHSVENAELENVWSVQFIPNQRGETKVVVHVRYAPPAGKVADALGRFLGADPSAEVAAGLSRFKQLMEAGEMATTRGQPTGAHREYHKAGSTDHRNHV